MKIWRIDVEGFPPYTIEAETRAKAKAQVYRDFCDSYDDGMGFLAFMAMLRVRREPAMWVWRKDPDGDYWWQPPLKTEGK